MEKIERIYLTGFMTCGKSTIGPILANVLGWEFYDLDKYIEQQEGMRVVEIFEANGEDYFRNLERRTLEALSLQSSVIISLGGGTLNNDDNLKLLKDTGMLVYLKLEPESIYKRIRLKTDRPLFKDMVLSEKTSKEDFIVRINELLSQRKKYYEQADLTISTDERPVGITVDLIAKKINRVLR